MLLPYNHLQSFHMFRLELLITSTNTLSLTLSPFNNLYTYNISSVTFKIDIVYCNLGLIQGLGRLFRMFHFTELASLQLLLMKQTLQLAPCKQPAGMRHGFAHRGGRWSLSIPHGTCPIPDKPLINPKHIPQKETTKTSRHSVSIAEH